MKSIAPLAAAACVAFGFAGTAQEKKSSTAHPVTITFYIAGVQCNSCVDSITDAVKKVPSVTAVNGLSEASGYALVSFDSHVSSFHQIARAIADANAVHGEPYKPTIRFRVPDYSQGENASKVDAIISKLATLVTVKVLDRKAGLFEAGFLPLKVDASKNAPQGFNGGNLGHPIRDEAPKGLGLRFNFVTEASSAAK